MLPLKYWLTFNGLHGIISQKTELFISHMPNLMASDNSTMCREHTCQELHISGIFISVLGFLEATMYKPTMYMPSRYIYIVTTKCPLRPEVSPLLTMV
jgi:hypothetical protein